ncbi:membrane-spanning 4-domains subfamily A member 4A [Epinephelus fuscoguttatus]|uniref:membrane-spanning 4-domains subfamily A member 4A n=1 Tax=Epinephelus fuscoguttatus TaxID=293821 RepID=UPI0020D1200F|nr:membrane-spanning 4-domains subfamily A member 4A [Epinephelus fuscoguttatus]
MTSTSITKVGGVVIVTQVIPQDEGGIALQSSPPASAATTPATAPASATVQAPPPVKKNTPTARPAKVDDMTAIFLRGQPNGLGVVQIFIGLLCILFSLTAIFSPFLMLHAPFCLAVTFMVSGSLSMAAGKRTSARLVWVCLVWNGISVLLGLLGVAYVCWLLASRSVSEALCLSVTREGFMPTDQQLHDCINKLDMVDISVFGPLGLLLVLLVLQVCVTITTCVFSTRALMRRDHYVPFMVEVEDDRALLSGAASGLGSDDALLGSGEDISTSPPNSP